MSINFITINFPMGKMNKKSLYPQCSLACTCSVNSPVMVNTCMCDVHLYITCICTLTSTMHMQLICELVYNMVIQGQLQKIPSTLKHNSETWTNADKNAHQWRIGWQVVCIYWQMKVKQFAFSWWNILELSVQQPRDLRLRGASLLSSHNH